ncbi:MAG: site-2 protease family protein, partial [Elusimicrobia bacterium]|nr:site-2 protease family protein [Elusimicrobiota bacterium]
TASGLEQYLQLLAVISVALGLFNLLPIPLVDGGMIVLFTVEGITGKRIKTKVIEVYNYIGLAFILTIFVFATYNDLLRLGLGRFFGR